MGQRGASLVQVMVISTILLGGGLLTGRVLKDQKIAMRTAQSRDDIETLHKLIFSTLQNQDHCFSTIGSATAALPLTPNGVHTSQEVVARDGSRVVAVLQDAEGFDPARIYMNNSVRIVDMRFVMPADFANLASFQVTYERFNKNGPRTKEGYGGKRIRKDINIVIQRNSSGDFHTCYASDTAVAGNLFENFCNNFGQIGSSLFYWDATNNTCRLSDLTCPNKLFVGINADGTAKCVALDDWIDLNDLIEPSGSPCDPALASNVRFVQVGNQVQIQCYGAISCSPVNACPASWGPNLSLVSDFTEATSWTSAGLNPSLTLFTSPDPGISGPNCTKFVRNSTSCNGGADRRTCIYNNSSGTGCDADGACSPINACPAPWGPDLAFSSQNIQPTNWTGLGHAPDDIVHDADATGAYCNRYIRNTTSCDSANQTRLCRYTNSSNTGCNTSMCTPVIGCPPAWDAALTYSHEDSEAGNTWIGTYDHPSWLTTFHITEQTVCHIRIRNNTSCDGAGELRSCWYNNSDNTHCANGCHPVSCPAGWASNIVFNGNENSWPIPWHQQGLDPSQTDVNVVENANLCVKYLRNSTNCHGQHEYIKCEYDNTAGTGCDADCTPINNCPTPWGTNLSLTSDIDSVPRIWPELEDGPNPSDIVHYWGTSPTECVAYVRNSTACADPNVNEIRECRYQNSSGTFCSADTGASCTPVNPCPSLGWNLSVMADNLMSYSWPDEPGHTADSIFYQWSPDPTLCIHDLRNLNTCSDPNFHWRQCTYTNALSTGCTVGSCTPVDCNAFAATRPNLSLLGSGESSGWPHDSNLTYYDHRSGIEGDCHVDFRHLNTCSEWGDCHFTNPANTGCDPGSCRDATCADYASTRPWLTSLTDEGYQGNWPWDDSELLIETGGGTINCQAYFRQSSNCKGFQQCSFKNSMGATGCEEPPSSCTPIDCESFKIGRTQLITLGENIQSGWPHDNALIRYYLAWGLGTNCHVEYRNQNTCSEWVSCQYNNPQDYGCDLDLCRPVSCDGYASTRPWLNLTSEGYQTQWAENPTATEVEWGSGLTCEVSIRNSTDCFGYKHCTFSNLGGTGCLDPGTSACSPVNACQPPWGGNLTETDSAVQSSSWATQFPTNPSTFDQYESPNGNLCRKSIRNFNICNGVNEWRKCEYTNSLNSGCQTCARPPGTGTVGDPFVISTPCQFKQIAFLDGVGVHFRVLSMTFSEEILPLPALRGKIDGQGSTVTDLYISNDDRNEIGIFKQIIGGEIRNIVFENLTIAAGANAHYVGGLAGKINGGTIAGVSITGTISGKRYVGGFFGEVSNETISVTSSNFSGTVSGGGRIGGLIGQMTISVDNACLFELLRVTADVKSTGTYSGGIAGHIQNCTFSKIESDGAVSAGVAVQQFAPGGFAGYATGNLTLKDLKVYPDIRKCGGPGAIIATVEAPGVVNVNNVVFHGKLVDIGGCGTQYTYGGFAEYANGSLTINLNNYFYDQILLTEPTGMVTRGSGYTLNAVTSTSRTTSEMQIASNYDASWLTSIWTLNNGSYPLLQPTPAGGCTPVNACPAPWGTLTALTSNNVITSTWSDIGGTGGETILDLETTGNTCNRYIRNINSCSGSGDVRHCRYTGAGNDGCIATAPPQVYRCADLNGEVFNYPFPDDHSPVPPPDRIRYNFLLPLPHGDVECICDLHYKEGGSYCEPASGGGCGVDSFQCNQQGSTYPNCIESGAVGNGSCPFPWHNECQWEYTEKQGCHANQSPPNNCCTMTGEYMGFSACAVDCPPGTGPFCLPTDDHCAP